MGCCSFFIVGLSEPYQQRIVCSLTLSINFINAVWGLDGEGNQIIMTFTDALKQILKSREIEFTETDVCVRFSYCGDSLFFSKREDGIFQIFILDLCDVSNMSENEQKIITSSIHLLHGNNPLVKMVLLDNKLVIVAETIAREPADINILFDILFGQLWSVRNQVIDNYLLGFTEYVLSPESKTGRSVYTINSSLFVKE